MSWWTDQALPHVTDRLLGARDIHRLRERVCAGLHGEVVEIGFGSGLDVGHYPPAVTRVAAVEPSDVAWGLAAPRVAASPVAVDRAGPDGARLDLADASFDSALSTFTLCTVPGVESALTEIRRVLRPGGALHFLEHGLAPDPAVVRWQRRLQPLQLRVGGGCHLDRPIADLVRGSGLEIEWLDTFYAGRPRAYAHVYLGRAVRS